LLPMLRRRKAPPSLGIEEKRRGPRGRAFEVYLAILSPVKKLIASSPAPSGHKRKRKIGEFRRKILVAMTRSAERRTSRETLFLTSRKI